MTKKPHDIQPQLREAAEARMKAGLVTRIAEEDGRDLQRLVQELQVHQIELEMQNETLRQTEIALKESHDRYVDLYEHAPVGYLTLNSDGKISKINLTGATLLGVERTNLSQKHFTPLVTPGDQDRWSRHFFGIIRNEGHGTVELALRRGDGTIFQAHLDCVSQEVSSGNEDLRPATQGRGAASPPVDFPEGSSTKRSGSSSHEVRIVLTDINERMQLEAARLAEAAIRVTATVFDAQEGMLVCAADGTTLKVNRAFSECTGYPEETTVGQKISQLLKSSLYDDAFFAALWESIRQSGSWKGEIWSQRKNGERFPAWVTITAVNGSDDVLTHYVVTLTDITEIKRLESEMAQRNGELRTLNDRLEESQTQLIQAEKMSAVGQLAAGIAHEINNPVAFVNSNLCNLRQYMTDLMQLIDAYRLVADACPPGNPAVLRANQLGKEIDIDFVRSDALPLLNESMDGLERIKHIVADLKYFSRMGESKLELADVHKCLDSTLNVIANELKFKADIVKEYGTLPEIMCMSFQLNQVFMNLLINAAQAIKEHGTITLRTGLGVLANPETVWVEVEDTGMGIPEENLKRIFEPFFTTKPIGTGTGLGLSVSYGIIKKHQGNIEVHSTLGKGTVFLVTLPICPQSVEEA